MERHSLFIDWKAIFLRWQFSSTDLHIIKNLNQNPNRPCWETWTSWLKSYTAIRVKNCPKKLWEKNKVERLTWIHFQTTISVVLLGLSEQRLIAETSNYSLLENLNFNSSLVEGSIQTWGPQGKNTEVVCHSLL